MTAAEAVAAAAEWPDAGAKKAINIHSVSRVYHFLFAQPTSARRQVCNGIRRTQQQVSQRVCVARVDVYE